MNQLFKLSGVWPSLMIGLGKIEQALTTLKGHLRPPRSRPLTGVERSSSSLTITTQLFACGSMPQ
jgi:hypothetical protein